MKKLFTIVATVVLTVNVFAQSPEKISYQAVIRNTKGELAKNSEVGMQISILQGASDGTAVYTETQTPRTNANGLVTVEIGAGTTSDDFSAIDWSGDTYFIKTEADLTGGENFTITGVSQLLSVPYALYAKEAGNVPDVSTLATKSALEDTANSLKAYVDELQAKYEVLETKMILNEGVTDKDGNTYKVVKIGGQIWMGENLKVTQYADGTTIALETDSAAWANLGDNDIDKAYCFYNNDDSLGYGALYTYAAATNGDISGNNVQGVCPDGWHLPSDNEWKTLEVELGMSQSLAENTGWRGTNEGSKLAGNADLWIDGNLENNSEFGSSGFTALPGGFRINNGAFRYAGSCGVWWSSTENDSFKAYRHDLNNNNTSVDRYYSLKSYGISVRCVRD